ncbi:MAG: SDR family oxidoreductase [Magnetospirillum sp.]
MMEISPLIPRTALVTGAARRLGRAMAWELSQAGFAVALHYSRSGDEAALLADQIRAKGGMAVLVSGDLSREDHMARVMAQAQEALGPIGVLVNNASTFERDEVDSATRQSWDTHMEVNLRAPFVLSQAMAAALPAEAEGLIVNLIDQRVWNLTPHFTTYTLSKAGLWTLTQTLALALAPRIRVAAIGPGPALPSVRQSQEQFDAQCATTPLARGTSPEEIALGLRFILTSRSFTGQMLALDGGQHLQWSPAQSGQKVEE